MKIIIVFLVLCLYSHVTEHASIVDKNNLTKLDCSYKDGRFGTINLSRVGLKHGIPAFRHVFKDDYFYSYNPCYPFSEESSCINVAACQIAKDGSAYYNLGINSVVTWSISADGTAALIYSTPDDRRTTVNLICSDQIDELIINEEYELRRYNLTLISQCACWNSC